MIKGNFLRKDLGLAQIFLLVGLSVMVVGLLFLIQLTQKNTDNRSNAAGQTIQGCIATGGQCARLTDTCCDAARVCTVSPYGLYCALRITPTPVPARYSCNTTTHQCSLNSTGPYTTFDQCQNNCLVPTSVPAPTSTPRPTATPVPACAGLGAACSKSMPCCSPSQKCTQVSLFKWICKLMPTPIPVATCYGHNVVCDFNKPCCLKTDKCYKTGLLYTCH